VTKPLPLKHQKTVDATIAISHNPVEILMCDEWNTVRELSNVLKSFDSIRWEIKFCMYTQIATVYYAKS